MSTGVHISNSGVLPDAKGYYHCFICGKEFDAIMKLDRHQRSATLRHYISFNYSNDFRFKCTACGIYVSTKEQLTMHMKEGYCRKLEKITVNSDDDCGKKLKEKPSPQANKPSKVVSAVPELFVNNRRPKRTKLIIPRERKAFFSVVSLLFDDNLYEDAHIEKKARIALDENNFMDFIKPEAVPFVSNLRDILNCEL